MSSSCEQDVFGGFGSTSDSRLNLQIKPLDITITIEYRVANSSALLVVSYGYSRSNRGSTYRRFFSSELMSYRFGVQNKQSIWHAAEATA